MNETSANAEIDRFRDGAEKYAAYLETSEGRLRIDLALANIKEFLQQFSAEQVRPLRALDIGAGTGAIAVALAQLGIHVTLMDPSQPMLDFASRAAQSSKLEDSVTLTHGDASQLAALFEPQSFDLIVCHNVLEFVDDPQSVLQDAVRAMRGPSSMISLLVRNQSGEVLKAALVNGDLCAAERNLGSDWAEESLYGGRVRLFAIDAMRKMLAAASLGVIAERGVRIISDYLPPTVSRSEEYNRIFELERKLGSRPEFVSIARYTQYLARPKHVSQKAGA